MLDIIFLSYDESNAEKNWLALQSRFPHAQHVHGIKGVKNAHQKAAELSRSDYFFIVDGDNSIVPTFDFTIDFETDKNTLYVWRCLNPVNELIYGYGGVKLYNKFLLLESNKQTSIDVATTVAKVYKPVFVTGSVTNFNATPYEAWRGAFRESVKLAVNVIKDVGDKASLDRLQTWCSKGADSFNGEWCLKGANQGRNYGERYYSDNEKLSLINNFDWLKTHYDFLNSKASDHLPFASV